MVTKRQNRKDRSVSVIFLIYSIFSNRIQITLLSRKAYDKSITIWLEKRWGARARWWAIATFQLTELNIKASPPCFRYVCTRGLAKWRHNLCVERMRDANVRNYLNWMFSVMYREILFGTFQAQYFQSTFWFKYHELNVKEFIRHRFWRAHW